MPISGNQDGVILPYGIADYGRIVGAPEIPGAKIPDRGFSDEIHNTEY